MRPQTGTQLERFKNHLYVSEYATAASSVLQRELRQLISVDSRQNMDAFMAIANLDGPWGAGSIEQLWADLNENQRTAVADSLDHAVENAVLGISDFIRSVGIRGGRINCAWSEVPLFAIDGFFGSPTDEPTRHRADLVAWRDNGDIDVLDLKVGNAAPPEWVLRSDREQVVRYVAEVQRRVSATHRVTGSVLYVARGSARTRLVRI